MLLQPSTVCIQTKRNESLEADVWDRHVWYVLGTNTEHYLWGFLCSSKQVFVIITIMLLMACILIYVKLAKTISAIQIMARVKLTLPRMYTTHLRHTKMRQYRSQEKKVFTLMEICMKSCKFYLPHCSIETHYWYWLYRSLFDVLLLKENDYSNKQWEYFGGTASLEKIRNAAVDQYVDSNVKFDTYIYNQISEILRVRLV